MRVDLDKWVEIFKQTRELNSTKIEDLELYLNGEPVDVPEEDVEMWKYVGLNNVHFVMYVLDEPEFAELRSESGWWTAPGNSNLRPFKAV